MAGPAWWKEGLWGWLSGELWVSWFRCGRDEKGGGEDKGEAVALHWVAEKCTVLLRLIVSLPPSSWAMMGPLLRAAGWLMSCRSQCQPKESNIFFLASAGWPKIEEMVWLLDYLMFWMQRPFSSLRRFGTLNEWTDRQQTSQSNFQLCEYIYLYIIWLYTGFTVDKNFSLFY